jgi:hypothetical protein
MFDLRYHVASLAAVFFALVIGILVGVALASHGLGNTERKRLEEDLRRAENQADVQRSRADSLSQAGSADQAFVDATYKSVVANRLKGKRVAVLFVGSSSDDRSKITQALADAGAGPALRFTAVKVPVDPGSLEKALAKKPFLAHYAGPEELKNLGQALGQEFVAGKDTPLWNALRSQIVEETSGPPKRPADGVVIVRTAKAQTGPTAVFLKGLYAGLSDVGVPVIGVEGTKGDGSSLKAFHAAGLSTVDDVDLQFGKLALIALLADPALSGDFGTRSGKPRLPLIAPLPQQAAGG